MEYNNQNLLIIAELSANHNNDLKLAIKTIEAIAKTGADAVKVQTYTADSLTLDVNNEYFTARKDSLWKGRKLYELYEEGSLPYEWHSKLKEVTESLGMVFFSSPFAIKDVEFLESINCPMYKIASMEITDIPLIEYAASKGKPMIISTGVAEKDDIKLALETCRKVGNSQITLLKCTSQYPATINDANLLTIPDMRDEFNVKVGVSDHTMGNLVPTVAVALGATVVEKHFTLDRSLGGVDSAFSMEPHEFKQMVESVRQAKSALGKVNYDVTEKDKNRRRSLFVVEDMEKGDVFHENNVKSIRPGYGLSPIYLKDIIGKKSKIKIKKGTKMSWDLL